MKSINYIILSIIIPLILSCNSEKRNFNDIYEKIEGNYEITEIKYISSNGADSSIFDVGTMNFSPCKFAKESSESYCDGSILLENPTVNGTFTFKVQQQNVLKLNIRIEENDFYRSLYENLSVHDTDFNMEGDQFNIIINKNPVKGSKRPYELVLSKY